MNKEIERKYSVNSLPNNVKINKIVDIEQAFIYRDNNTIIRIRKVTDKKKQTIQHIYTVKTKGDIQYKEDSNIGNKYEIESYITEEQYEKLMKRKISNIIHKTRIDIPIEKELKVEVDIYYDYLDGFLTAEIEFPNEKMAKNFNKPTWLGEELGYKELSNRKLAEMTKEEWQLKVTKEFIDNNRIVIRKLNEII